MREGQQERRNAREMDGTTRVGGGTREGQHDERVGEKVQTTKTTMTEMTMT